MPSVAARLGAFALVLTGTFATAYAVGENAPGHDHDAGHGGAHGGHEPTAPIGSAGYRLTTHAMGDELSFHLVAPDGSAVDEFDVDHTVRLHAIVVRPDLSGFQHVHPEVGADGEWSMPVPSPGAWHFVFELRPSGLGGTVVVTHDIDDGAPVATEQLPPAADDVAVDTPTGPLHVRRDDLTFSISDDEGHAPDGLEPYLGADAHLVALRAGDLEFAHLHPSGTTDSDEARRIAFGGTLAPGTYRLFLQFGHRGEVITVPFTVEVPS